MLRKYALTVVFLFVVCGAAAQLPDDEYYPYGTGYEQRTPIVLTDSSLFYRAIQTMPDLYGSISAFNLPYIALGRRGQHYSSEAASFSGLGISSRYFGSLRLLGAREERRAGIAALPEAIGGAGGVRTFRFPGALAEPSCHASVSFTDRNYLAGAKLAYARPAGRGWDVAAAVEARTGRDMHVEGVFTNALTAGFRAARHLGEGHTLGFLLIVPPSVRGTRLSSVEEAFRLTGDNLYNPAWGFQDGKVRNSRVRREFVPLAAATYCVRLSPATWHFIKLMGRSASHIALECALQTQPNICLISEEVEAKEMSLDDVVTYIATAVANRAAEGNNFGTVLIPEGLIEFIPAIKKLIAELNEVLTDPATGESREFASAEEQIAFVKGAIAKDNLAVLESLPADVARQLCLDRDPHGNVQVSLIETEKLLSRMVAEKLAAWKKEGKFVGKFSAQHHFFGYEGRCAAPSNYDADYCYSLGFNASRLIANGKTGYMSIIKNTTAPAAEWIAGGVPITMMMNIERRNGANKPVIRKALVELDGAPFKFFASKRDEWAKETAYVYPGPIQYWGPSEVCDQTTKTLQLEQAK